jgi:hypothetical protein
LGGAAAIRTKERSLKTKARKQGLSGGNLPTSNSVLWWDEIGTRCRIFSGNIKQIGSDLLQDSGEIPARLVSPQDLN